MSEIWHIDTKRNLFVEETTGKTKKLEWDYYGGTLKTDDKYYKIYRTEFGRKTGYFSDSRKRIFGVLTDRAKAYELLAYLSNDAGFTVNIEHSEIDSTEFQVGGTYYESKQLKETIARELYIKDHNRIRRVEPVKEDAPSQIREETPSL